MWIFGAKKSNFWKTEEILFLDDFLGQKSMENMKWTGKALEKREAWHTKQTSIFFAVMSRTDPNLNCLVFPDLLSPTWIYLNVTTWNELSLDDNVNVLKKVFIFYSPLKVAPSSDYASLAFFSSYDEEAILKVNAKLEGDVMISIFHARQTNLLFANKFEKILICRLYFHTGFLGNNR